MEERETNHRQDLDKARLAEQRFEAHIARIRASFMDKARQRVEQRIAQIRLRHEDCQLLGICYFLSIPSLFQFQRKPSEGRAQQPVPAETDAGKTLKSAIMCA